MIKYEPIGLTVLISYFVWIYIR